MEQLRQATQNKQNEYRNLLLKHIEAQLTTEPIIDQVELGNGMTRPTLIKLKSGINAVLKNSKNGRHDQKAEAEVAAFIIDNALELNIVPPTFYRTAGIQDKTRYSVQLFIEGTEELRLADNPPVFLDMEKLRLLDYLISNHDRVSENTLVEYNSGHAIAIDNGMGFPSPFRIFTTGSRSPIDVKHAASIVQQSLPDLLTKLKRLNENYVTLLSPHLNQDCIWGFGRRLQNLINQIERS